MTEEVLFEALGEAKLHAIIDRFVDRLFEDVMIGYLFRAADRTRVKAMEYEFAAQHLGAKLVYTGRPLVQVHRAHRITGGQFMRRLQLLKNTLAEFEVTSNIREHWVQHTLSLQHDITNDALDQCDPGHANRASVDP